MNAFQRGTTVAAIVLSLIACIGLPVSLAGEHGWGMALGVASLCLIAIWGSRLGANSIYRTVFKQGQVDERGNDSDFI